MTFDYRSFYDLGEAFTRGAFRVDALGDIPEPSSLTRAEIVPKEPIRFHHDQGGRLYDWMGTTWAVLDLVSDRVISVLNEGKFRGWTTYPIEIFGHDGNLVPGYSGLAVTGRCGVLDDSLSPVMSFAVVPEGEPQPHRIGLRFPETWDGSDLFSPEETTHIFATQPVRDALVTAKITNLAIHRITEIEQLVLD